MLDCTVSIKGELDVIRIRSLLTKADLFLRVCHETTCFSKILTLLLCDLSLKVFAYELEID